VADETPSERAARWAAEDAADAADPNFVFFMDGSAHFRESETGCCGHFGRTCAACGGFQHYQAVYGGYFYKCEQCGKEDA
jgi:hypothetical protein